MSPLKAVDRAEVTFVELERVLLLLHPVRLEFGRNDVGSTPLVPDIALAILIPLLVGDTVNESFEFYSHRLKEQLLGGDGGKPERSIAGEARAGDFDGANSCPIGLQGAGIEYVLDDAMIFGCWSGHW